MKVLITGGFGYLGGRLVKFLAPHQNLLLRIGTHRPDRKRPDWMKGCEMVPLDLLQEDSLREACHGVEAIIHLAALNEIRSSQNKKDAFIANSLGTLNLLECALEAGVKRFIYLSTAHIYGSPLSGDITETTLPRPVHPYAITHLAAEAWVYSAHAQNSIEGIIIRLSNGFGPPASPDVDRWTLLVNDLCRQAVTMRKIILKSAGMQKRDFIPITDVCRAILHFLELPKTKLQDGIFNLGGNRSMPVIEVAKLVAERSRVMLGIETPLEAPSPELQDNRCRFEYKIEKLEKTGFSLKADFISEIDETLKFCQESFR